MFTHILTLLLDTTFSQLTDQKIRSEAYRLPIIAQPAQPGARVEDVTDLADPATATAKLAVIMAVMTREARAIGSGVPNEYVQAMEGVSELEAFAAVVYSSNFEIEAAGADVVRQSENEPATADAESGRTLEEMSARDVEESLRVSKGTGIVDRATSIVDTAWGGFESVWARTVGGQPGPIVR